MEDWRAKLEGLNKDLRAQESVVQEQKTVRLNAFRMRLAELEALLKSAAEFGDAFGVDCEWSISRFDQRYPSLEFRIQRPVLQYRAECRDGIIYERLSERGKAGAEVAVTLEGFGQRRFQERLNGWVQAAANANRKVPGRRQ